MKVAELRAQGWTAIRGDVLTNGLSERIVLSFNGAFAVNNGHHDDLEIVDLLWRVGSPPDSFRGTAELFGNGWRPAFNQLPDAAKLYKDDTQCFGESVPKVPSDKMQEALKEADAISEGFLSSSVEVPAKPIFTQAMANNDELPPIGSLYLDDSSQVCKCIGYEFEKELVVGEMVEHVPIDGNVPLSICAVELAKVFDNRTEKQKAVDIANKEFLVDKPTLEAIYDLWAHKIEQ